MDKKFVSFVVILLLIFFLSFVTKPDIEEIRTTSKSRPTSAQVEQKVTYNGQYFSYSFFTALPEEIFLYSNLEERLSSSDALEKYRCKALVSAGFYTKENTHVGLFVSDKVSLSPAKKSLLFNGFYTISQNLASISQTAPQGPLYALQSGPILILRGEKKSLNFENDSPERRVVLALDNGGLSYFIILFTKDNLVKGPYLRDLPAIVENIASSENFSVESAINLDGGTASAFIDADDRLTEVSNTGGFFCIRN